jgi:membrane protein required for colicin V production
MNLVDLLVLAIVGISALLGLSRGLVRELLGLGSWVLAGFGAYRLAPAAMPMLRQAIGNPDIADPAAYAIVFVVLLILLSLLANLVGRAVEMSMLGGLDRSLGLMFGVLRAAVVLILAYIPLATIFPPDRWPPQLQQSRTLPWIQVGAKWTAAHFPGTKIIVPEIPDDKPTTSADLLHATPEGRALGPPLIHTN